MTDELPKEEAERRAREVAQRMLNTPRKPAAKPEKPKGKSLATSTKANRRKPS